MKEQQRQFIENLLQVEPCSCFLNQIHTKRMTKEQGLAVYRHNYHMGLQTALKNIYPVIRKLLGETCFNALAALYIERFPSQSVSLNDYGAAFAKYCPEGLYLSEVASLEWMIHQVLLGKENLSFDWPALAKVPPEKKIDLIFHRQENGFLYYSAFPVDQIWSMNQANHHEAGQRSLDNGDRYLWIWRRGDELRVDRLTALESQILHHLDGRKTLLKLSNLPELKEPKINLLHILPDLIKRGYVGHFSLQA